MWKEDDKKQKKGSNIEFIFYFLYYNGIEINYEKD